MKHIPQPASQGRAPRRTMFIPVPLAVHVNNVGSTRRADRAKGSMNIWGNSLPREDLPPFGTLSFAAGIPFLLSENEAGQDNVVCLGQSLPFPTCTLVQAHFIGVAERRNKDTFGFGADGQMQRVLRIGFSDFWPEARSAFGNQLYAQCSCLHYPRHTQADMEPSLWRIQSGEVGIAADHVRLPDAPAIHIFAMTLEVPADDIQN